MDDRTEELRSFFELRDTNGNGTLQYAEFVGLLRSLGAGMADAECRIGFREIDTDGDGAINFEEFLAWWADH